MSQESVSGFPKLRYSSWPWTERGDRGTRSPAADPYHVTHWGPFCMHCLWVSNEIFDLIYSRCLQMYNGGQTFASAISFACNDENLHRPLHQNALICEVLPTWINQNIIFSIESLIDAMTEMPILFHTDFPVFSITNILSTRQRIHLYYEPDVEWCWMTWMG